MVDKETLTTCLKDMGMSEEQVDKALTSIERVEIARDAHTPEGTKRLQEINRELLLRGDA